MKNGVMTREQYRGAWTAAYTKDPSVPLNIDIELASICNLKCPYCFFGEKAWNDRMEKVADDGKRLKRFMETNLALSIIDEAADIGVPALKFNWRGESTLHPDYNRILSYAAGKVARCKCCPLGAHAVRGTFVGAFHDLLVNTNANCKPSAIDGLMCATKVMVSLDSTLPEVYPTMRVQGDFKLAISTCRALIKRNHPNLWIRRVITKANAGEPFSQNLVKLLGPTGYKVAEHFAFDRGDTQQAIHDGHALSDYGRTYCGYPSQRLMISSNGDCYPCCVDTDGTMKVGKYVPGQDAIRTIWNDAPMRNLRKELRRDEFKSKICQKCESWMSYRAPQREFVQDVEVKR